MTAPAHITQSTGDFIDINPDDLDNQQRYKLLIGSVLPRPIAFVSTISQAGVTNLAPFSFFTGVQSSPLMVCFCPMIRSSDGEKKDTLKNLEATGECVVHVVSESIVTPMNACAVEAPSSVSEFDLSGLTPIPSIKVKPPRVKEALVQMECVVHQIVSLGDEVGSGSIVVAKVVYMHVSPEVYDNGKILTDKLQPISRLAGAAYARIDDPFVLERPVEFTK